MNRKTYYALRHNIRASGMEWNWGKKFRVGNSSVGPGKTDKIDLVLRTILNKSAYDRPKPMDYEDTDSISCYMRLIHEWNQHKLKNPHGRTRVWWQNFIRSNVRNDCAMFTHQLTNW